MSNLHLDRMTRHCVCTRIASAASAIADVLNHLSLSLSHMAAVEHQREGGHDDSAAKAKAQQTLRELRHFAGLAGIAIRDAQRGALQRLKES